MKIPIWQVDAFADRIFTGNPAAVCLLENWLPDAVLASIAMENNLAETAFLCRERQDWRIRWFTPSVEVDLCGHATLAAAFVLFSERMTGSDELFFQSLSGPLRVSRHHSRLALDFPARPAKRLDPFPGLEEALGVRPQEIWLARDLVAVLESEHQVRALQPDMRLLEGLDVFAVCVTAPGSGVDFVSRFFAPRGGIPEDPVTGSAHCTLVPYWAERLGRSELSARQLSQRGGRLFCSLKRDRVEIAGHAVLFLKGEISLGDEATD